MRIIHPVGLSQLEKQRQWLLNERREVEAERREREKEIREMAAQLHRMKVEKEKYENALFLLKSEISTLNDQRKDYRESCERKRNPKESNERRSRSTIESK
jgi:hypothetical protein